MAGPAVAAWLRPIGLHPDRRPRLHRGPAAQNAQACGEDKARRMARFGLKVKVEELFSQHGGCNVTILSVWPAWAERKNRPGRRFCDCQNQPEKGRIKPKIRGLWFVFRQRMSWSANGTLGGLTNLPQRVNTSIRARRFPIGKIRKQVFPRWGIIGTLPTVERPLRFCPANQAQIITARSR